MFPKFRAGLRALRGLGDRVDDAEKAFWPLEDAPVAPAVTPAEASRPPARGRQRRGRGWWLGRAERQAGDGRERALVAHVLASTPPGDLDAVIDAIDHYAYRTAFLINIGEKKGAILDAAVRAAHPRRLLELGTYCGYSALRIARVMPADAHLYSIERSRANARLATRVWDHAGISDRVTCVVGWLGDGGVTVARLCAEHRFSASGLDFVFLDHDKDLYVPDLQRILYLGWLHAGATVVAANVKNPGALAYQAYMRAHEATVWSTTEHPIHLEYRRWVADLVLESRYLGSRRHHKSERCGPGDTEQSINGTCP